MNRATSQSNIWELLITFNGETLLKLLQILQSQERHWLEKCVYALVGGCTNIIQSFYLSLTLLFGNTYQ